MQSESIRSVPYVTSRLDHSDAPDARCRELRPFPQSEGVYLSNCRSVSRRLSPQPNLVSTSRTFKRGHHIGSRSIGVADAANHGLAAGPWRGCERPRTRRIFATGCGRSAPQTRRTIGSRLHGGCRCINARDSTRAAMPVLKKSLVGSRFQIVTSGKLRYRLPVSCASAFTTAGEITGTGGSPHPDGLSVLGTM